MSSVVLLGPQRFRPTLRDAMASLGIDGPVALVTAGWQEREGEAQEMREHLGREVVDLLLYHRADDVMLRDRELATALRERQERLKELQELYRLRLERLIDAARELIRRTGESEILDDHRRSAIRSVRTLDREHLRRIHGQHEAFEKRWTPSRRAAVARHREQIGRLLDGAGALAIAGGHVAVLLSRLRLFDLVPLLRGRPVVVWSAGAMAVSEQVVLFHDSPPQGPGNAEVLDAGLGLCRGVLPLPHARQRLRLHDPVRVALLARRFAPAACTILEPGTRLAWDGRTWTAERGTMVLGRRGRLGEMARA